MQSFGNVVSFNTPVVNLIDVFSSYIDERGLTLEALDKALNGKLIPYGKDLLDIFPNVFRWKQENCIGAYAWEQEKGEWRGRLFYGPPPEVPRPGRAEKPPKYIFPTRGASLLFKSPIFDDWTTASQPYDLLIVEGVLNAVRLNMEGVRAVGIPGVSNFRVGKKGSPMIPELTRLLKSECVGRVIVMFDSDTRNLEENPKLWNETNQFLLELVKARKGREHTIYRCAPPARIDGGKNGPDDFLHSAGIVEFQKLVQTESQVFMDDPWFVLERKVTSIFIYDEVQNALWHTERRIHMPKDHANAMMMTMGQARDITSEMPKPKMVPFDWSKYLASPLARLAVGTLFNPSIEDPYFLDERSIPHEYRINLFNPYDVPDSIPGDISLAHWALNSICREDLSVIPKLLTIAAYHAQNPALTPKYAIFLVGDKGAGKSNLASLIGHALSKKYSSNKVEADDLKYTGEYRGFACREWEEYDSRMSEEWLKALITDEKYLHNPKYGKQSTQYNHTLNIFTSNTFQSRIQEGDRRFLICGTAKNDNKVKGLEFEAWVKGMGPNYFRHFLLNYDCSNYHYLDLSSSLRDEVIDASKSKGRTIADEVLDFLLDVEGLDIVPNSILRQILEPHRTSPEAFNKINSGLFRATKFGSKQLKIKGDMVTFRCFRNHAKWLSEEDTSKYREQYDLATTHWEKYGIQYNRSKY